MFTKKVNPPDVPSPPAHERRRGRPQGTTPQGHEARERLYGTAIRLIGERGYEATTMRDVAEEAGVSAGLLYKYFPSKRSVVLTLYDRLSAEYASRASGMPPGKWRVRFVFALRTCLDVLGPHRRTLSALCPVLLGDHEEGMFAAGTAFSRERVEAVFLDAVAGATDAPGSKLADPLGRLLYLLHLAVILWWLFDSSPGQRATTALVALLERILPSCGVALMLPQVRSFVKSADLLVREALFSSLRTSPDQ
jgi:AcrR family transcriptional regulator